MVEQRELILVRAALPEDGRTILAMLADLASFEGAAHPPRLDAAALATDVFGPTPKLNILVAEQAAEDGFKRLGGFLSYFVGYSTWEGRTCIQISDLWVSRGTRGQGIGSALLRNVLSRYDGKRVDVFVIRGNTEARMFYERLGFKERQEWCLYRIEAREPPN